MDIGSFNIDRTKKSIKISIYKKYNFPNNLKIVYYNKKILVISVETANWIVLDNEKQLEFFNLLKELNITDAIGTFGGEQKDIQNVLIQLEAKDFESLYVTKAAEGVGSIHIYLTNACNLRCPHCYMFAGERKSNEITTSEVFQLLSSYSKIGGKNVFLSGGEISLRNDLCDIVKYGNEHGLQMQLLTNGTLWTNKLIDAIAPYTARVQISIDGYSEEVNARIRGVGNLSKAFHTVERFIENKVETEISITPFFDESLKKDYINYVTFSKKLINQYNSDLLKIRFSAEMLDGREVCLTEDERKKYNEISTKIYSLYYGVDFSYLPFISIHKEKRIMNNCTYGYINVSATGDVYPCARIPSLKPIANIRKDSFDRIINLLSIAQEKSNINNLMPCKDCELKYICGGGCRLVYFREFTECDDLENWSTRPFHPRKCTIKNKEEYYNLMINNNHMLFQ